MDRRSMFALSLVMVCILAGATGQIVWKKGMSGMAEIKGFEDLLNLGTIKDIFTDEYILLGLILYGGSVILWLAALSTLEVSFMYPLLSLGYVITALFGYYFLGESMTIARWLGIALVVAGCFLIKSS